ncbi:MAG: hypothetical protein U0521_12445 [Anaerolineae bacterium]
MIVEGDERLMRVALSNLLGNAWKYTGKQAQPRVEFGIASQNRQPTYFVRDNGAGFDMTYSDKLFGVFQRLHGANEFPETASVWRPSSASCTVTAGTSGQKRKSTKARPSTFRCDPVHGLSLTR